MTEDRIEALAALHAACFPEAPWTAPELESLLSRPGVYWWRGPEPEHGFVLLRAIPPEGEILSIGVHPDHRGRGIGRALVARVIEDRDIHGATTLFLEVARDNAAARALYAACGFSEIATREGYYRRADGQREDAVVLRWSLTQGQPADRDAVS